MPDDTTILSLPLILPAQAQKHVTHNEALLKLDLMVQLAVINRTLTTAPALPTIGDRHIVAVGATGPWVGQSGRIAMYTQAGWQFTQPLNGWQAYVMAEGQMAFYNGLGWIALSDGPFTVGRLGVSATPDATNRLAVSSPATLLNHAGAGHQLKLNKALAGDTASLLFQTGFGGRAEMGTAGSDDFSVKVSADGSAWSVALTSAAATGEVTLPQPLHLGGQAADPGAPVDGTLWLNTSTGEVKVRSAGVTQVVGGGGGGVSDGDKGDITVSGSGTSWTIDAGVVSLGKLADMATDSFLGRDTAGTGAPEVLTPVRARGILNVADGATANAADASLRDRSTHTGTQAAGTITGLAPVATSGSAADLSAGVLPASRFNDTAHGSRAGGALHAVATGSVAGFMAATDKTKLDTITGTNTGDVTLSGSPNYLTLVGQVITRALIDLASHVTGKLPLANLADMATGSLFYRKTAGTGTPEVQTLATLKADLGLTGTNSGDQTIALSGDVTGTGSGSFAATIANDAVTNAKAANMATGTIKGRATAGTGDPEDLTGAQVTALLDVFGSGAKGLVPASGGGTTTFLRADGTFAAPAGGGGTPGGVSGEVQYNNAGAFAGAADVEIEGGQLRLASIATPTAPVSGGVKLYGQSVGGRIIPSWRGPSGLETTSQPNLALNRVARWFPAGNGAVVVNDGFHTPVALGTATNANVAATDLYTRSRRIAYRITTASTTAVCGWRAGADQWSVGGNAANLGGFHLVIRWMPDTGATVATHRAFCGMRLTAAPTDVEPSTLLNMCGMAWDAADANIQFMCNDGSGVATKIDLGASLPVPSVAAADVYEVALFSPPGTAQSVSYRIRNLMTGAEALGTVTTDLPLPTTFVSPSVHMSVGGTSSVIGLAINSIYIEADY